MLKMTVWSSLRLSKNIISTVKAQRSFTPTFLQRNSDMHEIHFKMTPYQVLNVADKENFDLGIAKKNYYKLCKAYHPDTAANKDEANEKFLMVKEAYSILKDPLKKKGYDAYGSGWKYASAEAKQQKYGTSPSSMYGDENAARDRNMDEDTFWEYMNAATYSERARFNNRSYGNKYTYTSDPYEYNPLTMLPGTRMTTWELVLWIALVTYALYIFAFVGTYNFLFAEDLEAFTKDTDIQALIRSELMNAYNNYDTGYGDAWSRIRRFLFHRSYEMYRHAENADDLKTRNLQDSSETTKMQDSNQTTDTDDQAALLKKKVLEEIQRNQKLLEELKDEDIKVDEVNKHIDRDP